MSIEEQNENKKAGVGGYLFGGIFLFAGLAVMVYVGLLPVGKYLLSGQWERVPATVLSSELHRHRSDGSSTYSVTARYRYSFQGQTFTSDQVGLYSGSDNVGDYWQQLSSRLDRARASNRALQAWVNPSNPTQAYLDRTFRWSTLIFGLTFGGVFALVGAGVMYLMRRGRDPQTVSGTGQYSSREKSGHWLMVGFGAVFILLPSPAYLEVWKEVSRGNYMILLVLLFPLAGAGIALAGLRMRNNYRFFGPTPLALDPQPGQAGGQVGGSIQLGRALSAEQSVTVWLSCIRCYYSGSGKDRKTRESIRWQNRQRAWCRPVQSGTEIQFCFDAPADQPATRERDRSVSGRKDWIRWRVELDGQVQGRALKRSWDVPVEAGSGSSRYELPDSHVEADQRDRKMDALESANQQIEVEQTSEGLHLISRAGRNLGMKLGLLVFGCAFAAVGTFLFIQAAEEGFMLYIMGSIFGLIGYPMVLATLYTLARRLDAWVRGGEVRNQRRWLGIVLFRREGQLLSADQLVLESGMSSTSNGRKTEYMTLYAKVDGKKLRLAEGIAGREAGEALREAVLRTLRLV
ncbi:MAG: hypothetical protein AOY29_13600 [Alcanivorax borkumensis]|uniref:Putative membrane protein n=1 Tax=Alcanivorax borkumensis (strain ATCC 700651 / DSM 11573 / NCIMB 13689 / SK2) TaxID=393595 RepID=Q0VRW3_ALCBS|nr:MULTISPECIES: DUF3592 domain-containing protein [Alcanivorax]OJH07563.1 MAG: hypothetical protein AOY29_13600 [Alcanivorax borkumensis]BAP13505.1 membrane protein [Alcanivorax sp. NBRC 101098]CAL16085.1 putative membrane protein [Alcanivorax borkumensis SK2]